MLTPFKGGVSHTKVDFGLVFHVTIIIILGDFHGSIEVLGSLIVVSLLSQDFTKLHESTGLSLFVFELTREFEIPLNEHLHLILIHLSINLISADLTKVTDCHRLSGNRTHLDSVSQGELVINTGLLVVTDLVVDDTKIDMCQELTSDICDFLVLHVILNGIIIVHGIYFTQLHVVHSYAIVSKCLTMNITDGSTHLQELLILRNGLLEFTKVIKEHSCGIVRAAFISRLTGSFTGKCEDLIIFKSFLCS
jgi:hypothetical protein